MVFHRIDTRLIINIPNFIVSNISSFFHLALVYVEGFEQATMQAKASINAISKETMQATMQVTMQADSLK